MPQKKRKTKALARRKSVTPAKVTPKSESLQAFAPLTSDIQLEGLGLYELKLTEHEERVLSEPPNEKDIRMKPTGAIYVPHLVYTRLLNRAFGRTGWALRPASKAAISNGSVVVPYLLYIHRQPVAFAMGEQEYFENNKNQTWGDALESTVASGLRRTCKRLGIYLELWDKDYAESFKRRHQGEQRAPARKVESAQQPRGDGWTKAKALPPAVTILNETQINEEQAKRLCQMWRRRGRSDAEVKAWLVGKGIGKVLSIPQGLYDMVCAAVLADGELR